MTGGGADELRTTEPLACAQEAPVRPMERKLAGAITTIYKNLAAAV
jgi:hypothetical protein